MIDAGTVLLLVLFFCLVSTASFYIGRRYEVDRHLAGLHDDPAEGVRDPDEEPPEYHELAHGRMEREPWRDAP